MPVRLLADYASLNLRYPGMLYIHFLFIFSYTKEACFTIRKNGSQILRIQRGGIRNKSHRPARTFVQVSNGYISPRTRNSKADIRKTYFHEYELLLKGLFSLNELKSFPLLSYHQLKYKLYTSINCELFKLLLFTSFFICNSGTNDGK